MLGLRVFAVFVAYIVLFAAGGDFVPEKHSSRLADPKKPTEYISTTAVPVTVVPAVRPLRVLSHYGVDAGRFRGFAVVEFGPVVGAPAEGKIVSIEEDSISVRLRDGTVLIFEGVHPLRAGSNTGADRCVRYGDPLGFAEGAVVLRAERGGRTLDPVALLWSEMSLFSEEAARVEQERKRLAEENRWRVREATVGRLRVPVGMVPLIRAAAQETGLDPAFLAAVAAVESGFNPRAVSPKGAMGVMQLMPGTVVSLGVSDPFDPAQNIRAGARYLRGLLDRFGNLKLALAAYNAGSGAVEQHGGVPPYPETQRYVRAVLSIYSP